ncbi:DNA-3-methyladenine glycosylase I [Algiphilus sp.]|uniref:DNA-3-methyladenine glycosylase I n=1 Tax=Algiphilus sp. TaxID=1872431 RepID=UPI0025B8A1ED|nr:DNA-3-methyladenine glycosylase I [Algiphilus sp.]MCK5771236.1 DNA-3-methyladenine glycosylase I [Algiphilus sp.]
MTEPTRCGWATRSEAERVYHDVEWGVPKRDEGTLFEFLILEGAQAGLSWRTILEKRENYRAAMDGFDPEAMARYGETERARLLGDAGIVRNRLKIDAAIGNARAYLALRDAEGGLAPYVWGFVDGEPIINRWRSMAEAPTTTALSDRLSKDLKKRGFRFVGSTIVYSYLQAVGVISDHVVDCFRHPDRA